MTLGIANLGYCVVKVMHDFWYQPDHDASGVCGDIGKEQFGNPIHGKARDTSLAAVLLTTLVV